MPTGVGISTGQEESGRFMLKLDLQKFYRGLRRLKPVAPRQYDPKIAEMRRILLMAAQGEVDYSSFDAEIVREMLEQFYYQEIEYEIEERLDEVDYLLYRLKDLPAGRRVEVVFI